MGPGKERGAGETERGVGSGVGVSDARDHIYQRLGELGRIILSKQGARREEAKKERSFLEAELSKVLRHGRGTVRLNPELERAIRRANTRVGRTSSRTLSSQTTNATIGRAPAKSRAREEGLAKNEARSRVEAKRSTLPWWETCKQMTFVELRVFIDESLREHWQAEDRPQSKNHFLDLLEMLADKGDVAWKRGEGNRASGAEDASQRKRKELAAERSRVREALRVASSNVPASMRARGETTRKVKKLRRHLESIDARLLEMAAGSKGPQTEKERLEQRSETRQRIIKRIYGDIERAFSVGGLEFGPVGSPRNAGVATRRLPWCVLPPGELSLERVLAHYERLGRIRPDVRYEPERIRKAYSLGPDGCYVGAGEFDGYVVFTFPYTKKALLERPVYGNAVYVLGPDWKRLSRMSKRELLADETHGVTKIVHRGDWFLRVVNALGLR